MNRTSRILRTLSLPAVGAFLLITTSGAIGAAQDSDPDTLKLETLTIEGKTLEFTKAQVEEIKTRIVAIGLQSPKGCTEDKIGLLVCRVVKRPNSHLKIVRCEPNEAICASEKSLQRAFSNPDNYSTTSGGGEGGIAQSVFSLNKLTLQFPQLMYTERTSATKIKKAIAALPGRPEDNVEILDAMLDGWPAGKKHPKNDTVKAFAKAYLAVARIGAKMDPLIAKASTRKEKQAAINREDDAMEAAIKATGLGLAKYNELSELSQHYRTLQHKMKQYIAKERQRQNSQP